MGVLFKDDHTKAMAKYDQWMEDAKKPEPAKPQGTAFDKLPLDQKKAAQSAYNDEMSHYLENPGTKLRAAAKANVESEYGVKEGDSDFQEALDKELIKQKTNYEKGLIAGTPGNFNDAFEKFKTRDIPGGIKQALKSIPLIGDLLLVFPKMMMSLFSGKPIGPVTAYKEALHERALGGAFANAGVKMTPEDLQVVSSSVMKPTALAPAGPAAAPESPTATDEAEPSPTSFSLHPDLKKTVREYAELRFTDFETGAADANQVNRFIEKYTAMVEASGIDSEAQRMRAVEIAAKTAAVKEGIVKAKVEAEKVTSPVALTDDKWTPMKNEIRAALNLLQKADGDMIIKADDKKNTKAQELATMLKDLPVVQVEGAPGKSQPTPAGIIKVASRSPAS